MSGFMRLKRRNPAAWRTARKRETKTKINLPSIGKKIKYGGKV